MINYSVKMNAVGLCDFLNENNIKKENIISIFRHQINHDDAYYIVIYETNV